MSRIKRKYYLISTSCLAGLFDISILLNICENYVCFGELLSMRTLVIPIIRNKNLISVQSWIYLQQIAFFNLVEHFSSPHLCQAK